MKIVFYSDEPLESEAIRIFLHRNNIEFEEFNIDAIVDPNSRILARLNKLTRYLSRGRRPVIEMKRSHGIGVVVGFDGNAMAANMGLKEWK